MRTFPQKKRYSAQDLVAIVTILRDPETGCPWDKIQTHQSIRMNFLEEAYEAVDAIDLSDSALLCEELGDVLMQVALHAQMEAEQGHFDWEDVCDGVCRKLILRHPHIFGTTPGMEGINGWDALKNKEKGRQTLLDELMSVPKAMPALMRSAKMQKRATRYGAMPQVQAQQICDAASSLQEMKDMTAEEQQSRLGDLLFLTVALATQNSVDPEQALQKANEQFCAQSAEQSSVL